MNTKLQDTIERTVVAKAPIQKVYDAIATTDGLASWFPNRIEGEVSPGNDVMFCFGDCGDCSVHIVDAKPYTYFAYRWIPGSAGTVVGDVTKVPNTLVEFRLSQVDEGTKIDMLESGFATLPKEVYERALQENTSGWEGELAELVALFEKS